MADQTIEIKLILRDELTKQLAPIIAQLNQLNAINLGRANEQMQTLGKGVQAVHRELSTLARIGFGGLIGGGVVAGIVATGKALSDMAGKGLQLRYAADSLGVSTDQLNTFSDAMMGLGKSQEEGAAGIQSAVKALRELSVEGTHSSLFKQLAETGGETGRRIGYELLREVTGPRGAQGALVHALTRMAGMRQDAAAKFGSILGFGPGFGRQAARDYLEVLGQLPKRIELTHRQQLDLAKANAALEISWDNIKTTLASALIPTFARMVESLSAFMQSPDGEKFTKQLEAWGAEMNKAVDAWLKGGGMEKAVTELRKAAGEIKAGFVEADKVIHDMGLSWPKVIGAVVALDFGAKLMSIAAGLGAIARIPNILALLTRLSAPGLLTTLLTNKDSIRDALQEQQRQAIEQHPGIPGSTPGRGVLPSWWDYFKQAIPDLFRGNIDLFPKAQPQSGDATPKTEPERRADLVEKKRESRELTDEFRTLSYDLAKLNDYIMPGGPEGGGGTSGFGAGMSGSSIIMAGSRADRSAAAGEKYFQSLTGKGKEDDDWSSRIGKALSLAGRGVSEWAPREEAEFGYGPPSVGGLREREFEFEKEEFKSRGRFQADEPDWYKKRDPTYGEVPGGNFNPRTGQPAGRPINFNLGGGRGSSTNIFASSPSGFGGGESGGGGISPIISHLASRDSTSINGSATVDIDVGGATEPGRDPSSLFRNQPLGGVQQMQNITQPPSNPLSFN